MSSRKSLLIAVVLAATPACADTTEHYGKWERREIVSPLTDRRSVVWGIEANEPNRGRPVFMAISCAPGSSIRIGFVINEYLGADSLPFQYRLDEGPIQEITAFPDEAGTSLLILMPDAGRLLKQMAVGRIFALGVTPYGANEFETVFNISGIDRVVKDLGTACGRP